MGRKKAPKEGSAAEVVIRSGPPIAAEEDDFEALDDAEGGKLAAAVEKLRSTEGACIEVVRVAAKGGYEYCDRYAVADYDSLEERVRADYGPGRYRVRFKAGDRYVPGGTTITIAAKLGQPTPGQPLPLSPTAPGLEGVLGMLREWREQDKAARALADDKWFKWAQLLAPVIGPKMMDVLMGGRSGTSPKDMLELIVAARDLSKGQGFEQQFEMFTRVIEAAKGLGGGDESSRTGSTWVDLVRDGINKAGDLARDVMAARGGMVLPGIAAPPAPALPAPAAPPAPARVPAGAPTNGGAQPAAAPNPPEGDQMLTAVIRQTLLTLVTNAARNKDPGLYADVTFDQMVDHLDVGDVKKRLGAEDWWQQCCALCPQVQQYPGWFREFRDALLECIESHEQNLARARGAGVSSGNTQPGGEQSNEGEDFH